MNGFHLSCGLVVLVAGLLLGGAATCSADATPLEVPIVFTQLPARPELEQQPGRCDGTLRSLYGEGGRIVRLDPDGTLKNLTADFASACGADVSFDGERILFAAQQHAGDTWNIWEMQADGSDGSAPRQITHDAGNCRSPAYQATLYTIVSTEPWFQIMFTSDAAGRLNEARYGVETSLYSCKLDGSALRRLTVNLSDDFDPYLMQDGRVLVASWQRRNLDRGTDGRVALFGVNTDGADYALYCGDQGRRIKHMPCETSGRLVVFVEADHVGWDGAGQLAAVTLRRPLYSYRPITSDQNVLYHSPAPLADGALLVSRRPADGSATHGLVRLDPDSGQGALVYDDPAWHDVHARVLTARPQPDGRSSVVNEKFPTGRLYCLNAYLLDALEDTLPPGTIKRLRVIEGVPAAPDAACTDPAGAPPMVQTRLLGEVPVESDGSFNIELPADVPVQLQTLDAQGMALASCGWIWVKHREPRGCIGCHEDPELTPENRFVQAVRRPSMRLTLPPERRRTVDFRRDILPIFEARCSACHSDAHDGLNLSAGAGNERGRKAYEALLQGVADAVATGGRVVGRYVYPGQARNSPLVWRLFGYKPLLPAGDGTDTLLTVPRCPPESSTPLTDDERRALIEWIDMGAQWDGLPVDRSDEDAPSEMCPRDDGKEDS